MTLPTEDLSGTYTGIGSRATPADTLRILERLARRLAGLGWTVRTGAAAGADQAFMRGAIEAGGRVDAFLPWPGFQGCEAPRLARPSADAFDMAARHHPAWASCGSAARALHARNSHEVLGPALDRPSSFVVCWTQDGSLTGDTRRSGGTGQALRIAAALDIPVFNLARADHFSRVEDFAA